MSHRNPTRKRGTPRHQSPTAQASGPVPGDEAAPDYAGALLLDSGEFFGRGCEFFGGKIEPAVPEFTAIPVGGALMMDFGCCIDLSGGEMLVCLDESAMAGLIPGRGTLAIEALATVEGDGTTKEATALALPKAA